MRSHHLRVDIDEELGIKESARRSLPLAGTQMNVLSARAPKSASLVDGSADEGCWKRYLDFCDHLRDQCYIDRILFIGDRVLISWSALPGEILGVLALLPILEPISDVIVINQLIGQTYYLAAVVLFCVLLAHWRFCTVYSALTPTASWHAVFALYCPFAILPMWGKVAGKEVSDEDLEVLYTEAGIASPAKRVCNEQTLPSPARLPPPGPSPPPSPPLSTPRLVSARGSRRSNFTRLSLRTGRPVRQSAPKESSSQRYGMEAARMRTFLEVHYDRYLEQRGPFEMLVFLASFEAKLAGLSFILGPFLLWRAALTIAHSSAFATISDETPRFETPRVMDAKAVVSVQQNLLASRILTFVEAILESLPQVMLQCGLFYFVVGSIDSNLMAFSAACSLSAIAVALFSFAQHRRAVVDILHPPSSAFAQHVSALCTAPKVDPATLLAAIAAARGAGVPSAALRDAVLRMKHIRIAHARDRKAKGSSAVEL